MTLFLILCIFCGCYYIVTLIAGGLSGFSLIWVFLCGFFGGLWKWLKYLKKNHKHMPRVIKLPLMMISVIFGAVFCFVEMVLLISGRSHRDIEAEYVIVLGAQVKGEYPSKVLQTRVMTALDYLNKHPGAKVIVSGGRGRGEKITEAECMRRILVEHGVDEKRIIIEDQSSTTYENLLFSTNIVGKNHSFVISTCHFHQFRAQSMAKKIGVDCVTGISGKSNKSLLLNYYVREFFAVVKYFINGKI